MLSFDMRSVAAKAVQVDAELSPQDPVWQDGDPVPSKPVHVSGRLSAAGSGGGRFYWHGRVEGEVTMPCRRCLADTTVHVQDEAHVIFAEAGSDDTEDPDVYVLDERSHQIDLRPAVREQWLLNVPSFAECREECRGICPSCGKELNEGPCDCSEAQQQEARGDDRWQTLRNVKTKD